MHNLCTRLTKNRKKRTTAERNNMSARHLRNARTEEYLHKRWHHSPTNWGFDEVHALGRRVSRLPRKPCMILKPVTLAVMVPRVAAARALVEMWPIETTPATRSEY
jgi:hypothetical protein